MKDNIKRILISIGVPLLLIIAVMFVRESNQKSKQLQYYEVVELFQENKVSEYSLNLYSGELKYKLRDDKSDSYKKYSVPNISLFQEDIHRSVVENNNKNKDSDLKIKYDYKSGSQMSMLASMAPSILPIILMVLLFLFIFRKMNAMGGSDKISGFGKAKIKRSTDGKKTTFADVAGADEEKEELSEIVDFLKSPQKFNELGARIPPRKLLIMPLVSKRPTQARVRSKKLMHIGSITSIYRIFWVVA